MANFVYFEMKFLRLHVRQKALLLLFFTLFLLPVAVFGRTYKSFFCVYFIISYAGRCDQDQGAVNGHTGKCFHKGYFNCEILYVRL